jgi:hypothetical protein
MQQKNAAKQGKILVSKLAFFFATQQQHAKLK